MLRDDWRNVLRAFCLRIGETAGYAVAVTFMLSYLNLNELASRRTTLTALLIAAGLGVFISVDTTWHLAPASGLRADVWRGFPRSGPFHG